MDRCRNCRAMARAPGGCRAPARLARLRQNLARLQLTAATVAADVAEWQAGPFDAVLLDTPCSSTGTIRRHPDTPWLKRAADITALAVLQRRLVVRAVQLTKPGGVLVYCSCSLEPEEGIEIVHDLLSHTPSLICRPLIRAWPAWTASTPPVCKGFEGVIRGWPLPHPSLCCHPRGSPALEGSQRLDVARFGRGRHEIVRGPGPRPSWQAHQPRRS